jgi:hypothetical protein
MGLHKMWNSVFWILVLLGYTQVGQRGLVKLKVFWKKDTTCCWVGYYNEQSEKEIQSGGQKKAEKTSLFALFLSALFFTPGA